MFCDLVDSTRLVRTLDPEEYGRVLNECYRATIRNVIEDRYGGCIQRFDGDGTVILFGHPKVEEDDAERAVRAALDLVTAVEGIWVTPDTRLRLRVGIAMREGVVGDQIGEGSSYEEALYSLAVTLAKRLQEIAHPCEVMISDEFRVLVGDQFEYSTAGTHVLKGFDQPIQAWKVIGERRGVSRFEAIRASAGLTTMVGRNRELQTLVEHWDAVQRGQGHVVTLRGDPGIGKSRLITEFLNNTLSDSRRMLRFSSGPRFQNTSLFPVITGLEQHMGLREPLTLSEKAGELESMVLATCPHAKDDGSIRYLATLLSLPYDEGGKTITETAERQKQRTLECLSAYIVGLARQRLLMVVWEDLHWADPTSLEFLQVLIEKLSQVPALLLSTCRPEFIPPWVEHPDATMLELQRLDERQSAEIVHHVTRGKQLPRQVLDQLLNKSDGIPLFLEEMTKSVLETGALKEQEQQYVFGSHHIPVVPASLHDSLKARLDRLEAGKDIAQVAAAIGREFSYELLAAVQDGSSAELQHALSRLVDADLIHVSGTPPSSTYTFKHALIQDAAYETMLHKSLPSLHARIANVLESQFRDTTRAMPELLAHHYSKAGRHAEAFPYWKEAGSRAKDRAAYAEGCTHFTRALKSLDHFPTSHRQPLELELQGEFGYCVQAARGYAAPEVAAAYQRARELCGLLGDTAELYPVLRGLFVFYQVRCEFDTAHELADHCVRLGKETHKRDNNRPEYLIEGYNALGYVLFYQGELRESLRAFTQAVELYRAHNGHQLHYPFVPQDPAVAALSALAIVAWMLGNDSNATQCSNDALALAESLNRPFDRAYAHCFIAMLENMRQRYLRAFEHAKKAIDIAQEKGLAIWLGAGTLHLGIAMGGLGQSSQALEYLTPALAGWEGCGARLNLSFFLAGKAETYRRAGLDRQALEVLDKAIRHAIYHNEHFYDAALFRIRGELRVAADPSSVVSGEKDFSEAIEIAQQQKAKTLELLAATSWHRASLANGRSDRSRQALEAALRNFNESDSDTPEVKHGFALLRETDGLSETFGIHK
jgi:class 3 adenylate cyclase/predicted ATPase